MSDPKPTHIEVVEGTREFTIEDISNITRDEIVKKEMGGNHVDVVNNNDNDDVEDDDVVDVDISNIPNIQEITNISNIQEIDNIISDIGGNINNINSKKRQFSNSNIEDEEMSRLEFQQWTSGFLNDEVEGDVTEEVAVGVGVEGGVEVEGGYVFPQTTAAHFTGVVEEQGKKLKRMENGPGRLETEIEDLEKKGNIDPALVKEENEEEEEEESDVIAAAAAAAAAAAVAVVAVGKNKRIVGGKRVKREGQLLGNRGDIRERFAEAVAKGRAAMEGQQVGRRGFSEAETKAIDVFVREYEKIAGLTHEQFVGRVWGGGRVKDGFWEILGQVLPTRTRSSLYKHVRRTYHGFAKRGTWTTEEDEQLRTLAESCGRRWKAVGAALGRMPEDCRDRWRNYVKCGDARRVNRWTMGEEQRLRDVVRALLENGGDGNGGGGMIDWGAVSEAMGGTRSRIQCRYKWGKEEGRLQQAAMAEKVAGMGGGLQRWVVKEVGRTAEGEAVDWNGIASRAGVDWRGEEMKLCWENLRDAVGVAVGGKWGEMAMEILNGFDQERCVERLMEGEVGGEEGGGERASKGEIVRGKDDAGENKDKGEGATDTGISESG